MLKKESDVPSRVNLGIRCSSCMGFKKIAVFEKPCVQLGVTSKDFACPSFRPDTQRLTRIDMSALKKLSLLAKKLRREELQILAFTFRNMDFLRKAGLYFGQRVYFSLGKDYISDYVSGRVIGANQNGDQVFISSNLDGRGNNAHLILMRESVMTALEFKAHRKALVKQNRLKPPARGTKPSIIELVRMPKSEYKKYMESLTKKPEEYEPPSMATVPPSWLDKRQKADLGNVSSLRRKKLKIKLQRVKDGTFRVRRIAA